MSISLEQDGFTLLELVIAMGLFATGLLGLMLLTSGLMGNNTTVRYHAVATQLARNKIEMLRQNAYSEIVGDMEAEVAVPGDIGGVIFSREVTVEENAGPAFKVIMVTVSWRTKGEHRVTLGSIVAAP